VCEDKHAKGSKELRNEARSSGADPEGVVLRVEGEGRKKPSGLRSQQQKTEGKNRSGGREAKEGMETGGAGKLEEYRRCSPRAGGA